MFAVSGQTPDVAEMNFLVTAAQLDTYGVDPHPVKVRSIHTYTPRRLDTPLQVHYTPVISPWGQAVLEAKICPHLTSLIYT